jgi:hypothetical protein
VDAVPDPLLLRKSGNAGNRTRDLWICSQELWPLDHRGGLLYCEAWIKIQLHIFLCFNIFFSILYFFLHSRSPLYLLSYLPLCIYLYSFSCQFLCFTLIHLLLLWNIYIIFLLQVVAVKFLIYRFIVPLVIFGFYYNTTRAHTYTHKLFKNLSLVTVM